MSRKIAAAVLVLTLSGAAAVAVAADPAPATSGTQVVVPGMGEVTLANDEARIAFTVNEQDKDKNVAVTRANQKMKQAIEALRAADPSAVLKTRDYYTSPVYEEPQPRPAGTRPRVTGWQVVQTLDLVTTRLDILPRTLAAGQKILNLNGMHYGLSRAATRKLDQQRIEAAWRDLNERIGFIARAMGRSPAEASIELVDYEASGAYAQGNEVMLKGARAAMMAAPMADGQVGAEPSFEPGETTLGMRVVAKIRFR